LRLATAFWPRLDWLRSEARKVGSHIGRLDNEDILRVNRAILVFPGLAISPRTMMAARIDADTVAAACIPRDRAGLDQ